jgi:uncharacterized protein
MNTAFQNRYGPWALVAGGGAGIGAAHARLAAANGLNVAIIDKDAVALDAFVAELRDRHPDREFLALVLDLADPDVAGHAVDALGGREIGLLIYNSAVADVGPFYKADTDIAFERSKIQVNMASPFEFVYRLARPMLKRGRGGVVLMSSGTGYQGAPYYAHYGATKAYSIVLAEGLWYEFKPYNVDVLACVAGMTKSPGIEAAIARGEGRKSFYQTPDEVAAEAMSALGKVPSHLCGAPNRRNFLLQKLLPRKLVVVEIAKHALANFLGGKHPPQRLD